MSMRDRSARRELLTQLAELPLFAGLDGPGLADLADAMNWLTLPGGSVLFEQDEDSDALYVLVYGRLAAIRRQEDGTARVVGSVAPGECVGEIGLITQSPRSTRVSALRDCELLRLPRAAFERLLAKHPAAMLAMARTALMRSRAEPSQPPPRCFALLPASPGIDARSFARALAHELGADPDAAVIEAEQARDREPGWFSAREERAARLIYVGDDDAPWRERCLRQSDCVLLLGDGGRAPAQFPGVLAAANPHAPRHLVLLQSGEPPHGVARTWRDAFSDAALHHVRNAADLGRLARRLDGKAVSLVLSGGGARGFAHIGAVRALREAGMPIDCVGGVSIGAMIGAGVAADWPHERLIEACKQCFVNTDPLSDWTIPLVSLRSGRKVSGLLRRTFGERDIEDLPLPFYAASSDLTEGALRVHERGSLWTALRASAAIPGVLPPVFEDGRVLVDGGVIDNMPVGEALKRQPGEIVAVDIGGNYRLESSAQETELPPWWRLLPEWFGTRKRPSLGQILLRSGMVNSDATVSRQRKQTTLLLAPELPGIDLLEWQAFDRAVDLGYRYTLRRLEESRTSAD